jgi:hypothetical protein
VRVKTRSWKRTGDASQFHPLLPSCHPFMNSESSSGGTARPVCGYAKAESSAIGITLGRRTAIKRRYRNCTFRNCSSQYLSLSLSRFLPSSLNCHSLARSLARSTAQSIRPPLKELGYIRDRGAAAGKKGPGMRESGDEPSLFSYSGIDPAPTAPPPPPPLPLLLLPPSRAHSPTPGGM